MKYRKIMIVDDDTELLEELSEMLVDSGYQTVAVSEPSRVVDIALDTRPDVALIDMRMPHMNGIQLANALRSHRQTRRIQVVLMSGYFQEGRLPLSAPYVDYCYLKKPLLPLGVIDALETMMSKKDRRIKERAVRTVGVQKLQN